MNRDQLDDALCGLRGWRSAGEQYARRGGRLLPLDYQVDVAIDEIEYLLEPEDAADMEVERPDEGQLRWALDGMKSQIDDGGLGQDLKTVVEFLEQPQLFNLSEQPARALLERNDHG